MRILIYMFACLIALPSFSVEKKTIKMHEESDVIEIMQQGVSQFYHNITDSKTLHHLIFWQSEESLAADNDPLEDFNRAMYSFNSTLDNIILKPSARVYKTYTPDIMQIGIKNFFSNTAEINTTINQLLQFKLLDSGQSAVRFLLNSTVGIGGLIEVLERPKEREDFGQTLGVWGVGSGPYLMLPFLGPSSMRDMVGAIPNTIVNNATISEITQNDEQKIGLVLTNVIQTRSILLPLTDVLEKSDDPYISIRNAYLQKRIYDVADGEIVLDDEEF